MTDAPTICDADEAALFDELVSRAAEYTDEWDPHTDDPGRTLLRIFAHFEADVRKKLNGVPEKHRIAFLDALDFERRPPRAAKAPLTFHVSGGLDRNVVVPGGTEAVAGTGEDSQVFEVPQDGGFEATDASLTDVVTVDPSADRIVDHGDLLEGASPVELFAGEDLQEHHLYLGNEDALNLDPGATLSLSVRTNVDAESFAEAVVWEYYGEDGSGTEGWHRLESAETEVADVGEGGIEAVKAALRDRDGDGPGRAVDPEGPAGDDGRTFERTFRIPGTVTERSVNGVESRWLRCRLAADRPGVFSTALRAPAVHVGSADRDDGLAPDRMLSNDVPLSAEEGEFKPLGELPQPPTSFYVACREAFTKSGGTVTLEFAPPPTAEEGGGRADAGDDGGGVVGGPPRLSWEYWNGSGWTRLDPVADHTDAFREPGSVEFRVPDDVEPTTVSGHENVWIRARLVSGDYGRPSIDFPDRDDVGAFGGEPDPPAFGDVSVEYEQRGEPFDAVVRYNNAAFSGDLSEGSDSFTPFVDLPEDEQTVYLGFDAPLRGGPLTLFVPVEDATYPESFDPGMEWEYATGPGETGWDELDVRDRTSGLTERGIVTLTVPTETAAAERFGRERHWIRLRATQDEFERLAADGATAASDEEAGAWRPAGADGRTTDPPVLEGIHPNTQWAYNERTVEKEILGSSDGSHDQVYECAHAPVTDVEVWVDELSTLSANERRRLVEQRPEDVERVRDDRGELTEFRVRWTPVDDFLDSGPTDRHYVATETRGTVAFGDGKRGAIPPSGQDNVRATYTTGGGTDGNVDAGTITDLKSSISLVDGVSNPRAADGGADVESVDALVSRSTRQFGHRGRAVTAADYEQVALAEFRTLSKVTCETTRRDGRTLVTVVVVPETEREKPLPSMDLKHRVRRELRSRAPATVVESDDADVVVREPGYAAVSVDATVRAGAVESVAVLKETITDRLNDYLHPLTGRDGEGWSFGAVPPREELLGLIEDLDAVSTVVGADVFVDRNGERERLSNRSPGSVVPDDGLVCSGDHSLRVTMEDDR